MSIFLRHAQFRFRCPLTELPLYYNLLAAQTIIIQCFCQTAPLRESYVAIREGPQKNRKRANLALYFYKTACRLNPGVVF